MTKVNCIIKLIFPLTINQHDRSWALMRKISNKMAAALLGFVSGIIVGEIMYYFTDELIFFIIVVFMTIMGWVIGGEIDLKEKT